MRFRLNEAPVPNGDEETRNDSYDVWVKEWDSADDKRREVILREILQSLGSTLDERKRLAQFADSFRHSCFEFGIEPENNPFIYYIQSLVKNNKTSDKEDAYINRLVELVSTGEVSQDRIREAYKSKDHFLMNPSIFYRNEKDFEYTVKIFDIVMSPTRLKSFIDDVSVVNIAQLYEGDEEGRKIKQAGSESTAYDTNTIYGVVEAWSEGNEVEEKGTKRGGKKLDYTRAQLEKIRKEKHYNDITRIPDDEAWEGNVVYVDFKDDMMKGQGDPDNWVDTWMVYQNGKWGKYNP